MIKFAQATIHQKKDHITNPTSQLYWKLLFLILFTLQKKQNLYLNLSETGQKEKKKKTVVLKFTQSAITDKQRGGQWVNSQWGAKRCSYTSSWFCQRTPILPLPSPGIKERTTSKSLHKHGLWPKKTEKREPSAMWGGYTRTRALLHWMHYGGFPNIVIKLKQSDSKLQFGADFVLIWVREEDPFI